jgi:eukaryotic-like serine/threonine-protein kinase
MRFARLLAPALLASVIGVGGAVMAPGPVAAADSGSWTQFHYAATKSGYDPAEKTLNTGNVGRIALKWQTGVAGSVYDTPLVSGGRVFVVDTTGMLSALRQSDGHKIWSQAVSPGFLMDSTPAIWSNLVVSPGTDSAGAFVAAYDVSSGARKWRTRVTVDPYASITAPAIYGSSVFFAGGTYIYALSASSGKVLWKTRVTTSADGGVAGPVAVSGYGEYVVAADVDGNVYALNAATGAVKWQVKAGGGIFHGGPAIYSGIVYVAEGRGGDEGGGFDIAALQVSDGRLLWKSYAGDDVHLTPAAGQGRVFVGSIDEGVRALDSKTGALLWVGPYDGEVWGAPMLANGVVYFGAELKLLAYNAATGAVVDSFPTSTSFASMCSPAVVNGRIYIGSGDNAVLVLGLP